LWEIFKYNLF